MKKGNKENWNKLWTSLFALVFTLMIWHGAVWVTKHNLIINTDFHVRHPPLFFHEVAVGLKTIFLFPNHGYFTLLDFLK